MLSPSAAFKRAVYRTGASLRQLVAIDDGVTTWKFTTGPCSDSTMVGLNPAVHRVDAFASTIDPETHNTDIGRITITMQDATMRPIIDANRMRGMRVVVSLGEESLAESDFEAYYTGFILDTAPQTGGNAVLVDTLSTWSIVGDTEIVGAWGNSHPLQNIEDILTNRIALNASFFDATTLDPSDSSNAVHSHLVASRMKPTGWPQVLWHNVGAADTTVNEATSAKQLIAQNLQIVDGYMIPSADGKIKFVNFDPTAAAVAHWGDNEIDELEQLDDWSTLINHVSVAAADGQTYEQNDDDSQSDHAYSALTDNKVSLDIDNPWIRLDAGQTRLGTSILLGSGDTTIPMHPGVGFSGFRDSTPQGSQPTDARPLSTPIQGQNQVFYDGSPATNGSFTAGTGYAATDTVTLSDGTVVTVNSTGGGGSVIGFNVSSVAGSDGSAFIGDTLAQSSTSGGGSGFTLTPLSDNLTLTRPLYWLLVEAWKGAASPEIVRVTTQPDLIAFSSINTLIGFTEPDPGHPDYPNPSYAQVDNILPKVERGMLGTTAQTFFAAHIIDITAQVYMAEKRMDRFSKASPVVQVRTDLRQFAVEQADLVTIDWPRFLAYNADGIDNTTKWQVISKEMDADGSEPGITWTLMRATIGTPTRSHRIWSNDLSSPRAVNFRNTINAQMGAPRIRSIADDFGVTDEGGLVIGIGGGQVLTQNEQFSFLQFGDITLTASMDTYVYVNLITGGVSIAETTVGGTRPVTPVGYVPIARVETDATSIVSITSLREESTVTVMPDNVGSGIVRTTSGFIPNGDFSDWNWG